MGVRTLIYAYMTGGICLAWRLLFFDKNNGDKFSTEKPEEDLLTLLVEKTKALGHMLTFAEASADPEMVQPNNYAYYFGSFGEAAAIAWRRARSPNSGSGGLTDHGCKAVEALKQHHQIMGRPYGKEVNWMSEFLENERRDKGVRYSAEQVKQILIDFHQRTGRLPKQTDVADRSNGLPSWTAMINHLGPKSGWQDIIDGKEPGCISEAEDSSSETGASLSVDATNLQKSEPALTEPSKLEATTEPTAVITGNTTTGYIPTYDDAEEMSEGCGRSNTPPAADESVTEQSENGARVEAHSQKQDGIAKFELKVTLTDREKPIFITLAV